MKYKLIFLAFLLILPVFAGLKTFMLLNKQWIEKNNFYETNTAAFPRRINRVEGEGNAKINARKTGQVEYEGHRYIGYVKEGIISISADGKTSSMLFSPADRLHFPAYLMLYKGHLVFELKHLGVYSYNLASNEMKLLVKFPDRTDVSRIKGRKIFVGEEKYRLKNLLFG